MNLYPKSFCLLFFITSPFFKTFQDCQQEQHFTYPLSKYGGDKTLQYYWYQPGNIDIANLCYLASEANQYSILKFGLLFCANSLPTNNDTPPVQSTDQENKTVVCDPLNYVCRSWNYTIDTLTNGIKNFTFVEGSQFETRINGSIQFAGLWFLNLLFI